MREHGVENHSPVMMSRKSWRELSKDSLGMRASIRAISSARLGQHWARRVSVRHRTVMALSLAGVLGHSATVGQGGDADRVLARHSWPCWRTQCSS